MFLDKHYGGWRLPARGYVSNVSCMLDLCPGVTFSMTAAALCCSALQRLQHAVCLPS